MIARPLWNLLALACLAHPMGAAQEAQSSAAQLAVAPSRLVLEGEERSAAITLINRGGSASTFEVAFQHFEMDEGGRLREVHPEGAAALEELLRVTPSRSSLQPGESQVFRVLLRKPSDLARGEYRVHLTFQAKQGQDAVAPSSAASAQAQIQVQTLPGISVPVIIRHGTLGVRIAIRDMALSRGKVPGLLMKLCREGDESVFGDLVIFQVDAQGAGHPIASRQGIAVYPSLAFRLVEIPFQDGAPPPGAKLKAVFTAKDQEAHAEAELTLPGLR